MIDAIWLTLNVMFAGFFVGGAVDFYNRCQERKRPALGALAAAATLFAGIVSAVLGYRVLGFPAWGRWLDRLVEVVIG